ncbi:LD-carboxypeptidase [Massilia sp. DWR3-1-1]|uniref:LD-carboxypeptidase n=1 Tax=Massilia sp. DWR3-1-1 TaxID=2804559 RepID=UPI003CE77EED
MTIAPGIAIIAPAGRPQDEAVLPRGVRRLQERGFVVHDYYRPEAAFQRFGGTDDGRLGQLEQAIADPDIGLILAMRGQYGLTRLLPQINFEALAASGKIVVGFSDLTALHMGLMAKTGAISYAGPMFAGDFCGEHTDELTLGSFFACLAGPQHVIRESVEGNPVLDVEGPVWGGNLSMMVSLLGTPYFPAIDDGIVFIEDVNEHPYRVERMLLQLLQAGVLGRQRALVIGELSAYRLSAADRGYDLAVMLDYLRATLPIPVLTGLRFGHGASRVTIPFGAPARLVSDGAGFSLTMRDYPTL